MGESRPYGHVAVGGIGMNQDATTAASRFNEPRIYFHIILRHERGIEALFEGPPTRVAAQARNLAYGLNCFIDRVHDKPGLTVCKHLRYRTVVPSNHRSAASQRLDHDQAEGLRPIDGKDEGIGIAYQLIFVFAADLPMNSTKDLESLRIGSIEFW